MSISEEEMEKLGEVDILPRHKAEYEFDKKFNRTRANQRIARVTTYYKCYSGAWIRIKDEDIENI